jgi:hypothetical protein
MQTLTFCEQQLQGGATQSVAWIGAGGQQQQRLPAAAWLALVASVPSAIAAIAIIERTRNMFLVPLKVVKTALKKQCT